MAPAPAPVYIETTVRAPAPSPGQPPSTGANVSLQLSGITAAQFAQKEQQYNHLVAQVGAHCNALPCSVGHLYVLRRCPLHLTMTVSSKDMSSLPSVRGGQSLETGCIPGCRVKSCTRISRAIKRPSGRWPRIIDLLCAGCGCPGQLCHQHHPAGQQPDPPFIVRRAQARSAAGQIPLSYLPVSPTLSSPAGSCGRCAHLGVAIEERFDRTLTRSSQ